MSTPTRNLQTCMSLSGPSASVKKKKYNCKFQADWMKDFQFLRPSSLGNESSFCTLCSVNFSVASGGLYDVKRHAKCETQIRQWRLKKLQNRWVFSSRNQTINLTVNLSWLKLFLVILWEHNLPFVVADHFTQLCSKLFPDSKITSKFACKRTKWHKWLR